MQSVISIRQHLVKELFLWELPIVQWRERGSREVGTNCDVEKISKITNSEVPLKKDNIILLQIVKAQGTNCQKGNITTFDFKGQKYKRNNKKINKTKLKIEHVFNPVNKNSFLVYKK